VDWAQQHHELVIAVLSPVLLAFGYFYRARMEKRSNLREALYLLLEIWHRMSALSVRSSEGMVDAIADRIRALFPTAVISDTEMLATKAHFIPIFTKAVRGHSLADVEGLQDAYGKVVRLVARSHPVYAYRLESASRIKRRLAFLDQYLLEAFQPFDQQQNPTAVFAAKLRDQLNSYAEQDVIGDLEKSLRGLALRVSVWSFLGTHLLIKRRRRTLETDSPDDIDRILLEVFSPMLSDPNTLSTFFPSQGSASRATPQSQHDSPQPKA